MSASSSDAGSAAPWSTPIVSASASTPAAGAPDPLPPGQEAGERGALDGLDLLAERGQRATAQLSEDVGVTPLRLAAVGSELALDDLAVADQLGRARPGSPRRTTPKRRATWAVVNGPWVRAIPRDEVAQRRGRPAR